jgi:hypothetical protein
VSNCVPGGWVAEMLGNKDVHTETQTETARAGRYTMVVGGGTNAAVEPAGDGYGLISLKSNGRIVCAGGLGDGHQLKPVTAVVSKNGDWPLYAMMYKSPHVYTNSKGAVVTTTIRSGSVISWMKFTNNGTSRDLLDGSLIWNKTGWTNPVCPRGFTNEAQVLGAAYTEPPPLVPALAITTVVSIIVKDGNLSLPFTNCAALSVNDTFAFLPENVNMQKLKINRKTGMVQGQFYHPDITSTTKATLTYGAVLQDDKVVRGYFVGTDQSGSIRLGGN